MGHVETLMRDVIELTEDEERMLLEASKEVWQEIQDLTAVQKKLQEVEKEVHNFEQTYLEVNHKFENRYYISPEELAQLRTAVSGASKVLDDLKAIHGRIGRETNLQRHIRGIVERIERIHKKAGSLAQQIRTV